MYVYGGGRGSRGARFSRFDDDALRSRSTDGGIRRASLLYIPTTQGILMKGCAYSYSSYPPRLARWVYVISGRGDGRATRDFGVRRRRRSEEGIAEKLGWLDRIIGYFHVDGASRYPGFVDLDSGGLFAGLSYLLFMGTV